MERKKIEEFIKKLGNNLSPEELNEIEKRLESNNIEGALEPIKKYANKLEVLLASHLNSEHSLDMDLIKENIQRQRQLQEGIKASFNEEFTSKPEPQWLKGFTERLAVAAMFEKPMDQLKAQVEAMVKTAEEYEEDKAAQNVLDYSDPKREPDPTLVIDAGQTKGIATPKPSLGKVKSGGSEDASKAKRSLLAKIQKLTHGKKSNPLEKQLAIWLKPVEQILEAASNPKKTLMAELEAKLQGLEPLIKKAKEVKQSGSSLKEELGEIHKDFKSDVKKIWSKDTIVEKGKAQVRPAKLPRETYPVQGQTPTPTLTPFKK